MFKTLSCDKAASKMLLILLPIPPTFYKQLIGLIFFAKKLQT